MPNAVELVLFGHDGLGGVKGLDDQFLFIDGKAFADDLLVVVARFFAQGGDFGFEAGFLGFEARILGRVHLCGPLRFAGDGRDGCGEHGKTSDGGHKDIAHVQFLGDRFDADIIRRLAAVGNT